MKALLWIPLAALLVAPVAEAAKPASRGPARVSRQINTKNFIKYWKAVIRYNAETKALQAQRPPVPRFDTRNPAGFLQQFKAVMKVNERMRQHAAKRPVLDLYARGL